MLTDSFKNHKRYQLTITIDLLAPEDSFSPERLIERLTKSRRKLIQTSSGVVNDFVPVPGPASDFAMQVRQLVNPAVAVIIKPHVEIKKID